MVRDVEITVNRTPSRAGLQRVGVSGFAIFDRQSRLVDESVVDPHGETDDVAAAAVPFIQTHGNTRGGAFFREIAFTPRAGGKSSATRHYRVGFAGKRHTVAVSRITRAPTRPQIAGESEGIHHVTVVEIIENDDPALTVRGVGNREIPRAINAAGRPPDG